MDAVTILRIEVRGSGSGSPSPFPSETELDESYFGGKRNGKRGRGDTGKVPGFGILSWSGKVFINGLDGF